jgi:hypothetical protein
MAAIRTVTSLLVVSALSLQASLTTAAERAQKPAAAAAVTDVRQQFIGHWRLVKFELFDDKGVAREAGYESGRIMYDADGNMSAQLMRAGRKRLSQPATEPERAAAYSTYTGYYGRYTIDPSEAKVTHAVEGALNPNWVKTDLVRYYAFSPDGTQLQLSLRNAEGRVTGTLTWARLH